ncbi:MAG: carbohydrate binding family 9 domain-containing protein [bacterium]|nr:carbohydrate binding family 9 domain-containing protein [bacterium]
MPIRPAPARSRRLAAAGAAVAAFCLVLSAAASVAAPPAGPWQPVRHPQLETRRAAGPIAVDGLLDDPGWQGLPRAGHFVEHAPGDQVQPPNPTEAMLTYDDDYLYAAFICYDDPAAVRASFSERDRIWNDDYVILGLDTFGDQAWAFELASNAHGVQGDLLWSAGYGEDMTYDIVFHSSGRITDEGWQVEMAIPWTSLRFPDREQQVWRVEFWRNDHRQVRGQYSWGIHDRNNDCWPCQWGTVTGINGVRPGTGLSVLPAMVATQQGGRGAGDGGEAGPWDNGKVLGEPSLGVAYGITPTVTAEATLNPDFSQVESDATQIDVNSTFALSYPEKRPFFQEGSDLWNTNFDAVYTRSLNRPFFAAKLTGRPGRTNFAALLAQDDATPFLLPFGEGSALFQGGRSWSFLSRVRHTMGSQSHVGFISTARWHEGGGYGAVQGFDTRLNLSDHYRLEAQALLSTTSEPDDPALTADLDGVTFDRGRRTAAFDGEFFTGHGLYASLERAARNWNFDADYWQRSPTFRAESGFEPRNDQRTFNGWTGYTFYYEDGLFERMQPSLSVGRIWDFEDVRKDEWLMASLRTWLRLAQAQFWVEAMQSNETFHDLQFDGITSREAGFQVRPSARLVGGGEISYGHRIARFDEVMGRQLNRSFWFNLKPWHRLLVEQNYDDVRSDNLGTGERLFEGYISRTRLNLQLSREWSVRLVVQYDDFRRSWDADPLVTFRLNPFSIFYVGSTRSYSEFTGAAPDLQDEWRLSSRTYFLKLQYLWQI